MEVFILAAMALVLLGLAYLIFEGGRRLRPGTAAEVSRLTAWPRLAVLVPVTGAAAGLAGRLETLLSQDYPSYQVVFTTRDAEDPATAVILALIPRHPRARHVVAGPARSCGQKNRNLLAAVQLVGQAPEILVFCDGNQSAPPDWLKELVGPIVAGQAQVTSGYHQLSAADPGVAALGRAISVLALYLTKGFRRLNQPWGGATAIRRQLFEDLAVARVWAENVVDDVSLAARLVRAGLPVVLAQGACLDTPIEGETLVGWREWDDPAVALPEVLHAGHLAGGGPGGPREPGPGAPGRGVPVAGAPRVDLREPGPGRGAVSGRTYRPGPGSAVLPPATRPSGEVAAGLLCRHGDGQLESFADLGHHGDALAGDRLPGRLAGEGGGSSQ